MSKDSELKKGDELIRELARASQLPEDLITDEIEALVNEAGLDQESLNLHELRHLLVQYALQILGSDLKRRKGTRALVQ